MPSILNTSLTGMLAFQRALEVTSHNISNANGTQISQIRRVYDQMQVNQLRTSTTGFARFNTLDNLASRIDTFLADPD